ncbi:unnamed protein product [Paramecium primaurelia]|uniref:Ubiquitin-like protease family profile domain-containing protein n=1 Tax=Paramecium primaurelia TaxID=5886 RepID=A0A8S1K3C8_PARPR|nr:unnamed protein product [Paramecium primaurelia]
MSGSNYDSQINQELSQEYELYGLLKANLGDNIFYVEPIYYQDQMRDFNQRNPTYGVTVEYKFLRTIQSCDFLESSQLQFFINLFRKAYKDVKLAAATCHFFADFIVSLQKPINFSQQNQSTSSFQRQDINYEPQNQQKVVDPQSQIKFKEDFLESKVLDKPIIQNPEQNIAKSSIITKGTNISNDAQNSIISNQQTIQSNIQLNQDQKYTQSQIQIQNPLQQDKTINRQAQSAIFPNKLKEEGINHDFVTEKSSLIQEQQITIDNQASQQGSIIIKTDKNLNQQDINIQSITQKSLQIQPNKEQEKSTINEEQNVPKNNQSQIIQQQFINSNVTTPFQNIDIEKESQKSKLTLDQQKIESTQVENLKHQSQIEKSNQQSLVEQKQQQFPPIQPVVENIQVQPPPEKKYHFQITGMTIEKPVQQEKIKKSQLPSLIKQLAEMNNLTEEELKQQDYWYFPINQLQSHWISVVIYLKKKVIYYFDSYYKKIESVIIQGINSILEYFNLNPQNFQIIPVYNQQINGYDCGVFILLSLLYTLQKKEYNYNQKVATLYRKSILYNLAVIGAQQDIDQDYLEFIIDQH